MGEKELGFTLGSDPECAIRLKGNHVNAREYLRASSFFGTDVPTTAELRPGVAKTPLEMVARLHTCFTRKSKDLPKELTFHAGHWVDGLPLGGHLHCGINSEKKSYHDAMQIRHYIYACDYILMDCLSNLIDDLSGLSTRRSHGSYGHKGHTGKELRSFNAVEMKSHGYEYRAPGSWLISPAVTYANVTLFAVANLLAQKAGGSIYDMFPPSEGLDNKARRLIIENLPKMIEIPECCKDGMEVTSEVIENRASIDWTANFREAWEF